MGRRLITWAMLGAVALPGVAGSRATAQQGPRARVYATLVSHNEEAISNPPCAPVVTNRERYLANRAAVVDTARLVLERGGAWDFQSEWQYLQAVASWDDAAVTGDTEGKNVVRWLAELAPDRIAVDAHSHERSGWNYADVAHALAQLGVPPTGIVGGFTASPVELESWTRLRAPLTGRRPPYPAWQAQALWGGASPGHRDDPRASGVWRPRDAEHYFEDDPASTLPNIGGWTADVASGDGLATLLDLLRTNRLEPGRMYTATIMIPQCNLDSDPALQPAVAAILDRFAPDVATGDLVWATLPSVLRTWHEEYAQVPVVVRP